MGHVGSIVVAVKSITKKSNFAFFGGLVAPATFKTEPDPSPPYMIDSRMVHASMVHASSIEWRQRGCEAARLRGCKAARLKARDVTLHNVASSVRDAVAPFAGYLR